MSEEEAVSESPSESERECHNWFSRLIGCWCGKLETFCLFPPRKRVWDEKISQKNFRHNAASLVSHVYASHAAEKLWNHCERWNQMSFMALFLAFRDFRIRGSAFWSRFAKRQGEKQGIIGNFMVSMGSANWVQILLARRLLFCTVVQIDKENWFWYLSHLFCFCQSRTLNPVAHKKSHMQIPTTIAHSV